MGIAGLLPFLSSLHKPTHISKYAGKCVAVDTSCWLHRGAFSCAFELALGQETKRYVNYIIKRINLLRHHKVYPVMVFDGCNAPSKKNTNEKRRETRQAYREKGKQFLAEGNKSAAIDQFQKSISITNAMILEVIKECHIMGIPVIVAPYEADAQLTYLVKSGICDLVITEDSDLLAFGCQRVLFKMDDQGGGIEIDLADMGKTTDEPRLDGWSQDKFRKMCIISGCDYLERLPKCGLKTVHKQFRKFNDTDRGIKNFILTRNLKTVDNIDIKTYYDQFQEAEKAFKYHLVFDPVSEQIKPLNDLPPHLTLADLPFLGKVVSPKEAIEIACGNINPQTGEKVADFPPNHRNLRGDCKTWRQNGGENGDKPPAAGASLSAFQFTISSNDHTKSSYDTIPKPGNKQKETSTTSNKRQETSTPINKREVSESTRRLASEVPDDILQSYGEPAKRSRTEPVLKYLPDETGEEKLFKSYGTGKRRRVIPQVTEQKSRFFFSGIDSEKEKSSLNPFVKKDEFKENVEDVANGNIKIQSDTEAPKTQLFQSMFQPNHRISHSSAIDYEKTVSAQLEKDDNVNSEKSGLTKLPTPVKAVPSFKCGLSKSNQSKSSLPDTKKVAISTKNTKWINTQTLVKPKTKKVGLSKPKVQPNIKDQAKLTSFFQSPPKSQISDSDAKTKSRYFS